MAGYLERYLAGEREQVWDELVALGAAVHEEPVYADALAVARETMQRARTNIEMLIPRLVAIGYCFSPGQGLPTFAPPSAEAPALVSEIERIAAGAVPLSLRAFYTVVGTVNFVGRCPAWPQLGYLDPLQVFPVESARESAEPWKDDDHSRVYLASDEYGKANTSGGGGYTMPLARAADAPLLDEWHETTFVNYLRICFRWGGFPGWERIETRPERDLAFLTEGLLPL